MAEHWSVTLDQQPAGQASFACAMDRDLLQSLRDVTEGRGLRLRSVSAALAERINHREKDFTPCVTHFYGCSAFRFPCCFCCGSSMFCKGTAGARINHVGKNRRQ